MEDREAMMLVAATIGVFHLVLANAIVAWRWLGSGHALSSVGWVGALIGGWLLSSFLVLKRFRCLPICLAQMRRH